MPDTIDPNERTAAPPAAAHAGPVTLVNGFVVPVGRDDAFQALWAEASGYFRAQPGFRSLRLHHAVSPTAHHRFVNVAVWDSAEAFAAAHANDTFRTLVSQPAWREFPNDPNLYEVVAEHAAPEPVGRG